MSDAAARSKALGEEIEEIVIDDLETVEPVEDEDAAIDAVALEAVSIPANAEIEIKACSRRISDGSRSRRGRFYLRRRQHEQLLERGAWYLFVVYESDDDGEIEEIVGTLAVPARVVDSIVSSWSDAGRGHGGIKQLTWTRLIDLEDDSGGDQA